MYQNIEFTVKEKIALIKMNCPESANALTMSLYAEIKDAVCSCTIRDDVNVVILTGEGKHFSAGGNIREFKELIESKAYIDENSIQMAGDTAETIKRCPKPVIAMINGVAAGAGASLSLACDFRIMEPESKISMAFINMGLPGDTGGIYYLHKLLGTSKTMEIIMQGKPISGETCYELGLATKLAESGTLYQTTMEFAKELSQKPMLAIRRQKEMLLEFFYRDIREFTQLESKCMTECSKSADFAEAVNAFLEKRKPVFQGK
ncbi:MAG: enoyl-CoA hydratase/isomerase family protein [Oliverpabstia sp.]